MSRDLNQCNFIGRLGNDPELKYLPNGDAVCNISIAVGDDYKDKNGVKQEVTEWVRIVAFRRLGEVINEYCRKGSKVFVSGKMKTRSWEKDNVKQYATEIVANDLQMLDSKSDSSGQNSQSGQQSGQSSQRPAQAAQTVAPSNFDNFDDAPF
ncbi:MAG: single-stranded DNA-binding protein [Candidatus Paceibacterota bacterium]|jgi:single-strand DNA-binding protein